MANDICVGECKKKVTESLSYIKDVCSFYSDKKDKCKNCPLYTYNKDEGWYKCCLSIDPREWRIKNVEEEVWRALE